MTARWYLISGPDELDLWSNLKDEFEILADLPLEDVAVYDNKEVAELVQRLFNE